MKGYGFRPQNAHLQCGGDEYTNISNYSIGKKRVSKASNYLLIPYIPAVQNFMTITFNIAYISRRH